jgi:cytochrome c peroxidase
MESTISYSQRISEKIQRLESRGHLQFLKGHFGKHKKHKNHKKSSSKPDLQFVENNPNTEDGGFQFHDQSFTFGEEELKGLKIFFAQKPRHLRPSDLAQGGIGNCIGCHAAPDFTDFRFHNTGIAQFEYDRIHGAGAFVNLDVPALEERNSNPEAFLPATPQHPHAQEIFRSVPMADNPQLTDLGVWNIFWNPDFLSPQLSIWEILCEDAPTEHFGVFRGFLACRPDRLLPKTIAAFKTPGLRDLGHSAPYSHAGIADTLEDVIRGYIKNSDLARNGKLRNGDPRLKNIALLQEDIPPLTAFLKSLNEDYE